MANHKSSKKRIRQTEVRTARNRQSMSRVRTFVRKVEDAITGGDYEQARAAFLAAEKELARGVRKGILKRGQLRGKFLVYALEFEF